MIGSEFAYKFIFEGLIHIQNLNNTQIRKFLHIWALVKIHSGLNVQAPACFFFAIGGIVFSVKDECEGFIWKHSMAEEASLFWFELVSRLDRG